MLPPTETEQSEVDEGIHSIYKGITVKKSSVLAIVIATLFASSAFAASPSIKIATGKAGKGYSKIYSNINKFCGDQVPSEELNTNGGFDNIVALTDKVATLAPVPVDVYQALASTDDAVGRLKGIMMLNSNMLHIVVMKSGYTYGYDDANDKYCDGKEAFGKCVTGDWKPKHKTGTKVITSVADLKGLRVAAVGSAQVLARRLFNTKMGYNLDIQNIDPDAKAFEALKKGEVKAVLTTAAYSRTGPIAELPASSGFTLVEFDQAASAPYKLVKKNYKNLGIFGRQFLTVPNMLMARPIDPASDVGQQITKYKACVNANLSKLQADEDTEPSWSDVNSTALPDDIPSWSGVAPSKKK